MAIEYKVDDIEYSDLAAALSAVSTTHDYGVDGIADVIISKVGTETNTIDFTGAFAGTPDANNYTRVRTTGAAYHGGAWDATNAYALTASSGNETLFIEEDFFHLLGLQIEQTGGGGSWECVRVGNADSVLLERSILRFAGSGSSGDPLHSSSVACSNLHVFQCIAVFAGTDGRGAFHLQNFNGSNLSSWHVEHCMAVDSGGIALYGFAADSNNLANSADFFAYNNIGAGSLYAYEEIDGVAAMTGSGNAGGPNFDDGFAAPFNANRGEQFIDVEISTVDAVATDILLANYDTIGPWNAVEGVNAQNISLAAAFAGADRDSRVDETVDIAGNARPVARTDWDLGPYQITAGGTTHNESVTFLSNQDMARINALAAFLNSAFAANADENLTNQNDAVKSLNYNTSVAEALANQNDAVRSISYTANATLNVNESLLHALALTFTANANESLTRNIEAAIAQAFNVSVDELYGCSLDSDGNLVFTANVSESTVNTRDTSDSISLSSIVDEIVQRTKDTNESLIVSLDAFLNQIAGRDINEASSFNTNVSENVANQKDAVETLPFSMTAADTYANRMDALKTAVFATTATDTYLRNMVGAATATFNTALDKTTTTQADFGKVLTFATVLAENMTALAEGALTGDLNFSATMSSDFVTIFTKLANIGLDTNVLYNFTTGNTIAEMMSFDITLPDSFTADLTRNANLSFAPILSYTEGVQADLRPSLNFDLSALETSVANKTTIVNLLLNLESAFQAVPGNKIAAVLTFALNNDLDLILDAELNAQISFDQSVDMSAINQLTANTGITFGHLATVASLAPGELFDTLSESALTSFEIEGSVLSFSITTPRGRTIKIKFHDRVTIIE